MSGSELRQFGLPFGTILVLLFGLFLSFFWRQLSSLAFGSGINIRRIGTAYPDRTNTDLSRLDALFV